MTPKTEKAIKEAEAYQRAMAAVRADAEVPMEGQRTVADIDADSDELFWEQVDAKVKADLGYVPHAA